jgi:hypothetical protein
VGFEGRGFDGGQLEGGGFNGVKTSIDVIKIALEITIKGNKSTPSRS